MTSPHTIHALQFELSLQGNHSDSTGYAEWVQIVMLPVIDEVLELQAKEAAVPLHSIYRIPKLEIDLGDIDEKLADPEIARRLRAQLSSALFEHLQVTHQQSHQPEVQEKQQHHQLQQFLRSGQLPWEYAGSHKYAHCKLIRTILSQNYGQVLLRTAAGNPLSLMRLIRQFETGDLMQVCRQSLSSWTRVERESLLDWISLELALHKRQRNYQEDLWLHIFSHAEQQRHFTDLAHTWYSKFSTSIIETLAQYEVDIDEKDMWSNASREQALNAIANLRAQLSKTPLQFANDGRKKGLSGLGPRDLKEKLQSFSQHQRVEYFRDLLARRRHDLNKSALQHPLCQANAAIIAEATDSPLHHVTLTEVQEALRNADTVLLKKHWHAILLLLPYTLASFQRELWPRWLTSFDARHALELVGVLQPQAHWIVSRLLEMSDTPQVQQLFKLAIHYALPIPAKELSPQAFLAILADAVVDTNEINETLLEIRDYHQNRAAIADSALTKISVNTAYTVPLDLAIDANKAELNSPHLKPKLDVATAMQEILSLHTEAQLRRFFFELTLPQRQELLGLLKRNEWIHILTSLQPTLSSLMQSLIEHQQGLLRALLCLKPTSLHNTNFSFSEQHLHQAIWRLSFESGLHYQQETHFIRDLLSCFLNLEQVSVEEWHALSFQLNLIPQSTAARSMSLLVFREFDQTHTDTTAASQAIIQGDGVKESHQNVDSDINFNRLSPLQKLSLCNQQLPHLTPLLTELLRHQSHIFDAAQSALLDFSGITTLSPQILREENLLDFIWKTFQNNGKQYFSGKQFLLSLLTEIFGTLPLTTELLARFQYELASVDLPYLTHQIQRINRSNSVQDEFVSTWLSDIKPDSPFQAHQSQRTTSNGAQARELATLTTQQALKALLAQVNEKQLTKDWNALLRTDLSAALQAFHDLNAQDKLTLLNRMAFLEQAALAQAIQWKQAKLIRELLGQSERLLNYINPTHSNGSTKAMHLRNTLLHRFLGIDTSFTLYTHSETVLAEALAVIAALLNLTQTSIHSRLGSALELSSGNGFKQQLPFLSLVLSRLSTKKFTPIIYGGKAFDSNGPMSDSKVEILQEKQTGSRRSGPDTNQNKSMVRPLLASFRAWQQGVLPLTELQLTIEELWQFLEWWLAQCSSFGAQYSKQLTLNLHTACEICTQPQIFLETVLNNLRIGVPLEIDLIVEQLNWQAIEAESAESGSILTSDTTTWQDFIGLFDDSRATPPEQIRNISATDAITLSIRELQPESLSVEQLRPHIVQILRQQEDLSISHIHQLLELWCKSIGTGHTMTALIRGAERYATRVPQSQEFLTIVLRKLIEGDDIDLEAMSSPTSTFDDLTHYADALTNTLRRLAFSTENAKEIAPPVELKGWLAAIEKSGFKSWLAHYLLENFFMPLLRAAETTNTPKFTSFDESPSAITSILMQASPQFLLDICLQVLAESSNFQAALFLQVAQIEFAVSEELVGVLKKLPRQTAVVDQIKSLFPAEVIKSITEKAAKNGTMNATSLDIENDNKYGQPTTVTPISTIPRGWRDALPRLLADAFLSGDLRSLDVIWPELTQYHSQELAQAQNRYLQRAEQRLALLEHNSHEKILDLVSSLSEKTGILLIAIQRHGALMCEIWKLAMTPEALFEHCLQSAYHQLFTAHLGSFSLSRQLPMLLAGFATWPSSATAQAQHFRALYYHLELQAHDKFFGCVSELVQLERTALVVEVLSKQSSTQSLSENSLVEQQELLAIWLNRVLQSPAELCVGLSHLSQLQQEKPSLNGLMLEWSQALASRLLAELPPKNKLQIWKQLARQLHEQKLMTLNSNVATPTIKQESLNELVLTLLLDSISAGEIAESDTSPRAGISHRISNTGITHTIDTIILLLQRASDPSPVEQVWLRCQIMDLVKQAPAQLWQLEPALQRREQVQRLSTVLDSVDMEYLFTALRPALHRQLNVLMLAIGKVTAIELHQESLRLNQRAWISIYEAAFAVPAALQLRNFSLRVLENLLRSGSIERQNEDKVQPKQSTLSGAKLALVEYFTNQYQQQVNQTAQTKQQQEQASKLDQIQTLKKRARLLGEEEPIPYGDSNVLNAGMVLIAPYIQRLFNLLELTKDGVFVNDQAAERAVHLLQYVVTAEASTPEYQLTLNKLLCGIHGGVPIVSGIDITPHEKSVIEQMLLGVINHWSALGKTSITGLRQTFLMREGQLNYQDESWYLRIPTSTFDMLLDRLSWSFAMIKFPWMRAPLHVTWR